ncbi:hypothetical protein [Duffyella gerundensis]|nr:hypothetical protein [Duffyella gerundensis]
MYISDEEKGNRLIGQAAMHLIFGRQDVTVSSLLAELKLMAENESDDDVLMQMHETRRWLAGYRCLSSLSPERAGWLDDKISASFGLAMQSDE